MPRLLRATLVVLSFAMFFTAGALFGLVVFPLLRLVVWNGARHRRICTTLLQRSYPYFVYWLRVAGLVDYRPAPVPAALAGRGYLLIANHPTILDVVLLLGSYEGLTSVVKATYYRSRLLRPMLRATSYVPGPGVDDHEGATPVLDRIVDHLRDGHPLVVFPEGTRSKPAQLRRFRRGVFEAALRAGVPIVALYLDLDTVGLCRERLFPRDVMRFEAEILEIVEPEEAQDAAALANRFQRAYRRRFEQTLSHRRALAAGREEASRPPLRLPDEGVPADRDA